MARAVLWLLALPKRLLLCANRFFHEESFMDLANFDANHFGLSESAPAVDGFQFAVR